MLLLPTLNEEEGLERTLEALAHVSFGRTDRSPVPVVVDGHSKDGTRAVAQRWNVPVLEQTSHGKGGAVREGLYWAREQGAASVGVMDADATYPCASLPALFDLLEGGHDLVVGVRQPDGSSRSSPRESLHRVGNSLLNYSAALLSRHPVLDVCSGFWGLTTSALEGLPLESDGFEIEAELFVRAFRGGLRVAQIPIGYHSRTGTAKLHTVRDGARILLSIIRYTGRVREAEPAQASRRRRSPLPTSAVLSSVLLALHPARVLLLSGSDRAPEAQALARALAIDAPGTDVAVATLAPTAPRPPHPGAFSSLLRETPGLPAPVVVQLPPRTVGSGPSQRVLLGLPRTGRLVELPLSSEVAGGGRSSYAPEGQGPFSHRPNSRGVFAAERSTRALRSSTDDRGFLRRERRPRGRRQALRILTAGLDPSRTRKELAFLDANVPELPLEVYRRRSPPMIAGVAPLVLHGLAVVSANLAGRRPRLSRPSG